MTGWLTPRGKYFLVTSIFPVVSVIYGVFSLGSPTSAPRIIQDALAFCGVFVLGLSVLRHQNLDGTPRHTSGFPPHHPVHARAGCHRHFLCLENGHACGGLSDVVGFYIWAVGLYDLTREFLERLRHAV